MSRQILSNYRINASISKEKPPNFGNLLKFNLFYGIMYYIVCNTLQ